MTLKTKIFFTAVLSTSMLTSSSAITLNWLPLVFTNTELNQRETGLGQFDQTGTFHSANNYGAATTDFDGITFTGTTAPFGLNSEGFHSGLASSVSSKAAFGGIGAGTVPLVGLTIGHTYRVQVLVGDGRSTNLGRTVSLDGINQGIYANGVVNSTWGSFLLLETTFTADTTTQNFTTEVFDGTTSLGAQVNALTVYTTAVPEPSSVALLGFGGAALILRRRK